MKNILFIASEPKKLKETKCSIEHKKLLITRTKSRFRDSYQITYWDDAKGDELIDLLETHPEFIHYCGHGNEDGEIQIEDLYENVYSFDTGMLKEYLDKNPRLECVVLCNCYSSELVEEIKHTTKYAIGFLGKVKNDDMHEFTETFYEQLFKVGSPLHAYLNTTDRIKAIRKQGIQPIFRSKLNYVMEAKILNKDLILAQKELRKYKSDIEFAEKVIARINTLKGEIGKEKLDQFHKLVKTHPTPNEIIWFSTVKDDLALEIAKDIFKGKTEDEIDELYFDLRMLFMAFEAVLISYDDRAKSDSNIVSAMGGFSPRIYTKAIEKLEHIDFACGKSNDFKVILSKSLDYTKSVLRRKN